MDTIANLIDKLITVNVNHPRLKPGACPVRDMGNRLTRRLR